LKPVPPPGLAATRVTVHGETAWVLSAPLTGRHVRVHPRLRALLALLDGQRSIAEALALLPPRDDDAPADEALLAAVPALLQAGVLRILGRAAPLPRKPQGPLAWLRALVFTRLDLGDLGRALPVAGPLLGWLFTPLGVLVWAAMLATAAALWIARPAQVADSFRAAFDVSAHDVVQGLVVFTVLKVVHECGHMVAARQMARAEGREIRVFRAGISLMFLMPAPYIDVSSTWLVASRWRRALVGAAGVQVEMLIAAIAGITWAFAAPGELRDAAFQTVLVCGVSSLLFNANPLMRLDGYYVMSDLLDIANLQGRGMLAVRGMGQALVGAAAWPARAELPYAAWSAASWCYRWVVHAGIFWLAWSMHWLLGVAVVAVIGVLFVGVPVVNGVRAMLRSGRGGWRGVAVVAAVAALLVVPLPERLTLGGIVEHDGAREVFAQADGLVEQVAPPGEVAAGAVLVALRNPETERMLRQLAIEAEQIAVELRMAEPGRYDALGARAAANARQQAELEAERAAQRITAPVAGAWQPTRAEHLRGAWVRREDQRALGTLVPAEGGSTIRLVIGQHDGPRALAAVDQPLPMRAWHGGAAQFTARPVSPRPEARGDLPSPALARTHGGSIPAQPDAQGRMVPSERVFELRLVPDGMPPLRHGTRVEARLSLPPSALVARGWRAARQALQQRLAT
jgi:putative peptide zinc metalloprotease protein